MYRTLPKPLLFGIFAWLVLAIYFAVELLGQVFACAIRAGSVPSLAWLVLGLVTWSPIWRGVWRRVPALREWFPDLNGEWDVELCSNWPRQLQLIEMANGRKGFDIRTCDEKQLAELPAIKLKAQIRQTWWSIEMTMQNPTMDTPIEGSETIAVEPFPAKGLQPATICYFYKQRNQTSNVADDTEFYGAARLTYNLKADTLSGLTWTSRMWPRAMNTAGPITFRRAI